jgi:hypothetical protein
MPTDHLKTAAVESPSNHSLHSVTRNTEFRLPAVVQYLSSLKQRQPRKALKMGHPCHKLQPQINLDTMAVSNNCLRLPCLAFLLVVLPAREDALPKVGCLHCCWADPDSHVSQPASRSKHTLARLPIFLHPVTWLCIRLLHISTTPLVAHPAVFAAAMGTYLPQRCASIPARGECTYKAIT